MNRHNKTESAFRFDGGIFKTIVPCW